MTQVKVKGAGRCPKCASRKTIHVSPPAELLGKFYADKLEVCVNCKAIWEPFDPVQLLDADRPTTSSFREPCDNCAFRPDSVEQRDPEKWAELMASLKSGGRFYCHKGVPIDPTGPHGFAYPTKAVSEELCPGVKHEDVKRLRMCRGWLRMWGRQFDKERERGKQPIAAAEEPGHE